MDVKTQQPPSIFTIEGYFARFYEIKGVDRTDLEAYTLLEEEYFEKSATNRYSTFGSFKTSKWKYLQKLQKGNIVVPKGQHCCT